MTSPRQILPDTNLFFECKRLEDVPWADLGTDIIEVILTKPVLDEIDRHKKEKGRTKKRALDTYKRLRPILLGECEEVLIREERPKVTLILSASLAPSERLKSNLDLQKTDDHLVALVAALIDDGQDALLLTHDAGPAATAKTLNVPFFLIPEEWLRPAEESQEEKRIRQLEQEIRRYAAQDPHLTLKSFIGDEDGTIIRHKLPIKIPLDSAEIDGAIKRLKAAHPPTTDFSTPPAQGPKLKFRGLVDEREIKWAPPTKDEQKTYLDEHYPAWLTTCRDILSMLHERLPDPDPCYFGFDIENDGTRPALNMRVEFRVDGSAEIVRERNAVENEEGDTTHDGQPSADPRPIPPTLPPPPSPPTWKKKIVKRVTTATGSANQLSALHNQMTTPYARFVRDLQRPLSWARQLEDQNRLLDTARIIRGPLEDQLSRGAVSARSNLPSIPIVRPHDPEAFYYDDWSPDLSVKSGALTCGRFRHHSGTKSFSYRVEFLDEKELTYSILCTAHAENLTDPVQLRVKIEQVPTPTKPLDLLEELLTKAGVPSITLDSQDR